jgi:hypothetical protein
MTVFLDQDRFVPTLEKVADLSMPSIEELSINAIQLSHPEGQIAFRRLDEEMIMVRHETI